MQLGTLLAKPLHMPLLLTMACLHNTTQCHEVTISMLRQYVVLLAGPSDSYPGIVALTTGGALSAAMPCLPGRRLSC